MRTAEVARHGGGEGAYAALHHHQVGSDLPTAVALSHRLRLVRLEPLLQLLSGHIDGLVELLKYLLVALCHLASLRLAAYANPISIFGSSTRVAEKRSLQEYSCFLISHDEEGVGPGEEPRGDVLQGG